MALNVTFHLVPQPTLFICGVVVHSTPLSPYQRHRVLLLTSPLPSPSSCPSPSCLSCLCHPYCPPTSIQTNITSRHTDLAMLCPRPRDAFPPVVLTIPLQICLLPCLGVRRFPEIPRQIETRGVGWHPQKSNNISADGGQNWDSYSSSMEDDAKNIQKQSKQAWGEAVAI